MQPKHNILISGGGTGGHIFPAIAIAQELEAIRDDLNFIFVGAKGKMEMEKVPKAGYQIVGLPVSAFHRRLTWKNILFPFKLALSMFKAARLMKQYRPSMVIGTGGFASGPIMKAAIRRAVPVIIQEQNAFPGVTNRLVAPQAARICVAHEGLEKWFPADKIQLTGNPVRKDLEQMDSKKRDALAHFGVSGSRPLVLVFGGSLGSLTLNRAMAANMDQLKKMNLDLIWQTGKNFYAEAAGLVAKEQAVNIQVFPFLEQMDLAYAAATVVICRAGAITLSELAIAGRPCVLVPYPHAAGDHQMKNARSYEEKGAARVVADQEIEGALVHEISRLIEHEDIRENMVQELARLARPKAGAEIAATISQLINERVNK